ncbi:MAG: signal recognition particle protein [Chloroflexi bacterium RBG_16_48_8]|nr:MAG: signal recognition particle protein [Chloroflexi bacterium RBG_16_48_8]
MFESLAERLQVVFRDLSRRGKLREEDVDAALREIRLALLEADVHYRVVKDLLARVREKALSGQVSRALNPSQQVIKILHNELVSTLGEPARLNLSGALPRVIMLVGLQGSGKTTTAAKLAKWLRSLGERVWMVAADPYRPAASQQLTLLGEELDVPVFYDPTLSPPELCAAGVVKAHKAGAKVVILDTAGRSQLDKEMMDELVAIRKRVEPVEIILVADAMTGQEAVNIAQGFHKPIGLTGLILSKMDGDARGGAAISMREVTGVPIKFIGTGESRQALETFEPDRLASRIMGMGDVLSLIERAEAAIDRQDAEEQVAKFIKGDFTLDDFAKQLTQMRRMGSMGKILEMLPGGLSGMVSQINGQEADRQIIHTQAIIQSMTPLERRKPDILNASRRRRIAAGSGMSVQQVNQLIRSYLQMKKVFKRVGKHGLDQFFPGFS